MQKSNRLGQGEGEGLKTGKYVRTSFLDAPLYIAIILEYTACGGVP